MAVFAGEMLVFAQGSKYTKADVPALAKKLKDKDHQARVNAAGALVELGKDARDALPAMLEALKENRDFDSFLLRQYIAQSVSKIGPDARDAIPALREALKAEDTPISLYFVWALRDIGKDSIPGLTEALKNKDGKVRAQASLALAQFGKAAAGTLPSLVEALCDPDEETRVVVAGSILSFDPDHLAAINLLVNDLVLSKSVDARFGAVEGLAKVGPKYKAEVALALKKALRDKEVKVRLKSQETLRTFSQVK